MHNQLYISHHVYARTTNQIYIYFTKHTDKPLNLYIRLSHRTHKQPNYTCEFLTGLLYGVQVCLQEGKGLHFLASRRAENFVGCELSGCRGELPHARSVLHVPRNCINTRHSWCKYHIPHSGYFSRDKKFWGFRG